MNLTALQLTIYVEQNPDISEMKGKRKYFFLIAGIAALILFYTPLDRLTALKGNESAGTRPCSSVRLERMTPDVLRSLSFVERLKWYENKLSPCKQQLKKSADRHNIPEELLATIILNELSDIDLYDKIQEWVGVGRGSVGIAQIQIDTAIFHKLVDVTGEEIERYQNSSEAAQSFGDGKPSKEEALKILVGKKLTQPEIAIEAAAREIRKILENIRNCSNSSWEKNFLTQEIKLASLSPDQIYNSIRGETQREKSINLARMVAAPYNSTGIECVENPGNPFSPNDGGPFPNPRRRGELAALIAEDLYDGNLFKK
ncbi:MAG TPA: hypothetical protein VHT73_14475 [Thermodesulfobacteriota bacterium]|nr:hypothetical protein [Thermodesulfobacteriota bacterium]